MKDWGPITIIEWFDSCSIRGGTWHSHDDAEQLVPDRIKSVGWVLKETKEAVTMVPHTAEHSVGGEMCIPKVAITKRWILAQPKRKR
jgi:hypothetical protein